MADTKIDTITCTGPRNDLSTIQAWQEINIREHMPMGQGTEITDTCARTIASWYASPGTVGNVLAQLATTGTCNVTELLDDIYHTRKTTPVAQHRALDYLATWALNHPSREA